MSYTLNIQSLLRVPIQCLQAHPTLDVYILIQRERHERKDSVLRLWQHDMSHIEIDAKSSTKRNQQRDASGHLNTVRNRPLM